MSLMEALRETLTVPPPLPGSGHTAERHAFLLALGRRNLSLARLGEAHWDAVAILAEANREPVPDAIYGVWAAEVPGSPLRLINGALVGTKPFCSGAGLIDRALVTVTEPLPQLIEIDLRGQGLTFDDTGWHTHAFQGTRTSTVRFADFAVSEEDHVGPENFYLKRAGFWHGACGPAACWAGGAVGLVDWAMQQTRNDAHTLAHLGAMRASQWALESLLRVAGEEVDRGPDEMQAAHVRALIVRHLVEVHATDILRRLARAYGPRPLAFDEEISTRYQELDLYLRQSHAERDLQALGAAVLDVHQT